MSDNPSGGDCAPWVYNYTSGGYDLTSGTGWLHVNTRFSSVSLVWSEERDGYRWTYQVDATGGRRWRATRESMEFKDVSREEAQARLRAYREAFQTKGLPKKGRDLVGTLLKILDAAQVR